MDARTWLVVATCALTLCACEKNPASPDLGDEYRLPESPDYSTLDGGELVFWPVDTRTGLEATAGVFAASADGMQVHRMSRSTGAGYTSPTLLADGRVAAIATAASGPVDIVIFEWGEPVPQQVDFQYGPEWIGDLVALRGPSASKLMYTVQDGLRVVEPSTGQTTLAVPGCCASRPAALPDGRIAFVSFAGAGLTGDSILIVRVDGTEDLRLPLPSGLPTPPSSQAFEVPVVMGLSDGRLLLAHRASETEVQFYVADASAQPAWTRVTGFPDAYLPKPPEFRAWGVQLLSEDRLAYVHEDRFDEAAPYFTVLVGRIAGTAITGVHPVFRSRIDTRNLGNGSVGLYYLEWVIYR